MDLITKLLPESGKTVIAALGGGLYGVYMGAVGLGWAPEIPPDFNAALIAFLGSLGVVGLRHGIAKNGNGK